VTCSAIAIEALFAGAHAQTTDWVAGTGNWSTSTNWDNGVPTMSYSTSGYYANVANGGTAQITTSVNAAFLTVAGGSTIELQSGGNLTAYQIVLGGATSGGTLLANSTGTITSAISFASSSQMNVAAASGQTLVLNGNLYGESGIVQFGSATNTGTVILNSPSGPLTYLSSVVVAGGVLQTNTSVAAIFDIGPSITVDRGATFNLNGTYRVVGPLSGGGNVVLGNNGLLEVNTYDVSTTFSGVISGSGMFDGLIKAGSGGTLTLSGANTYTGGTDLFEGALSIAADDNLGNGGLLNTNSNTTLYITASGTFTHDAVFGGTINVPTGNSVTWTGLITGTIAVDGGGVFAPTNIGNNIAETYIAGGSTLLVGNLAEIGTGSLTLGNFTTTTSGTLELADSFNFDGRSTTLGVGGGVIDTNGFSMTDPSAITGPGGLTKSGAGTLTLTGMNTYTGTTNVDGGTLVVSGFGNMASHVVVNSGGTLIANGNTDYIQNGVTVNSGETLSGTGAVGPSTIASGGTLSPGSNGFGRLMVSGNLSLAPGSNYTIAATPTANGSTYVYGSAGLAGTVVVTPSGNFSTNQQIDLLMANDGISGTFSTVEVDGSFGGDLVPVLGYDARDAFITLKSFRSLLPAGAPLNETNIVNAIDYAIAHDGATTAFTPLANLSAGDFENALSQMVGEVGIDTAQSVFDLDGQFMDTLSDQSATSAGGNRFAVLSPSLTRVAFAGPGDQTPLETTPRDALQLWGTAYGRWDHLGGDSASLGTHTSDDRNDGVVVGAEYQLDDSATIGAALGAGWTSWNIGAYGNGAANGLQVGLYGSKSVGGFYLSAAASYTRLSAATDRTVTFAGTDAYRARFDPESEAVELNAARRFALEDDLWLSPFADFRGQLVQMPAYNEATVSGSGLYALSYTAKSQPDVTHDLGLELDHRWTPEDDPSVDFNFQAGWVHQYAGRLDSQIAFGAFAGSNFTAYGTRGPDDAVRIAGGFSTAVADSLSLAIEAQTLQSGASQSYGGNATLTYRW
jgi:autotransporter-associated beta strand protein